MDYDYLEKLAYAYAYVVDRKMAQMLVDYHQPIKIYDHWQDLVGRGEFSFMSVSYSIIPLLRTMML